MLAIKIIVTIFLGFFIIAGLAAAADDDLNTYGKSFLIAFTLTQILAIVAVWL